MANKICHKLFENVPRFYEMFTKYIVLAWVIFSVCLYLCTSLSYYLMYGTDAGYKTGILMENNIMEIFQASCG